MLVYALFGVSAFVFALYYITSTRSYVTTLDTLRLVCMCVCAICMCAYGSVCCVSIWNKCNNTRRVKSPYTNKNTVTARTCVLIQTQTHTHIYTHTHTEAVKHRIAAHTYIFPGLRVEIAVGGKT